VTGKPVPGVRGDDPFSDDLAVCAGGAATRRPWF